MPITVDEIGARFKHYPPRNEHEIKVHEEIRLICLNAGLTLMELLPSQVVNSREFSQVLTNLEDAMMHANAAYARHK